MLKQAVEKGRVCVHVCVCVCVCVCVHARTRRSVAVGPLVGGARPMRPINAWTVGVALKTHKKEKKKKNKKDKKKKNSDSCGRRLELPGMPYGQSKTLVATW